MPSLPRMVLANLLLAAVCGALAWLGLALVLPDTNVAPLWPAAGIALAALWRWGPWLAPGVVLGSALANLLSAGLPWWAAGLTGLGSASGAMIGAHLLRRMAADNRLGTVRDVLILAAAAATAAVPAAIVGTATLALVRHSSAGLPMLAWTWWSGDLIGAIVTAPILSLSLASLRGRASTSEALAIALLAVIAPIGLFSLTGSGACAFLALPPLLWAALRLGPPGATIAVTALAGSAWAFTAAGMGPFAGATTSPGTAILLQAFIGTASATTLLLAAAMHARESALTQIAAGEERYRLIADHARDLICLHELDGRFRWLSASATGILGHRPEELLGWDPWSLVHHEDTTRLRADSARKLIEAGTSGPIQFRIRHANGSWVWLEMISQVVRNRDGAPTALQTVSRDVTRRRAEEETLEQAKRSAAMSERMAAIGTLAGGVAHEFNNLNAVILGNVELALRHGGLPEDARLRLEQVREAVERERGIVDALLAFSRPEHDPGQTVDVGTVVATTIALSRRTMRQRHVTLTVDVPDQRLFVRAPGSALGQVLLNLLLNACDAVDRRHDPRVWITLTSADGRLRLSVRDNGVGIRPEDLPHIFMPFYSTKGDHARTGSGQPWLSGTGLGLSVCQNLVGQMDGTLTVESAPEAGSTFIVTVPLAEAPVPAHDSGRRPTPCARVLVVDDEPAIRHLLAEHIAAAGHVAVEAEDGRRALDRMSREEVDLVMLNWSMPGMDGQAFLEHLELHPDRDWPPVVVVSGWIGAGSGIERWRHEIAGELRKPFSLAQVRKSVNNALLGIRDEKKPLRDDDSSQ